MYDERFAEIYDVLHVDKDYARESAYVLGVIDRFTPTAQTLLEAACGTGLFLERFRDRFAVEGVDSSAPMLARAATRVPAARLHQADMCSFSLGTQFDVVCCLFRSIASVGSRDRFQRAVGCLAGHVRPGGVLIIEPHFTPDSFRDGHIGFKKHESAQLKVAWMHAQRRVSPDRFRYQHQFVVGAHGELEQFAESHEIALLARSDYDDAFAQCGLALHYDPVGPTGVGLYIGVREG